MPFISQEDLDLFEALKVQNKIRQQQSEADKQAEVEAKAKQEKEAKFYKVAEKYSPAMSNHQARLDELIAAQLKK